MPIEYEPTEKNIVCHYANGVKLIIDFLKQPFGDRSPDYITRLGTCPVRFMGDEGSVETGDEGEIVATPESLQKRAARREKASAGSRCVGSCAQLLRLHAIARDNGREPGRDAALAHRLSCGGDRLDPATKAAVRSSQGRIHRRRRRQSSPFSRGARLGLIAEYTTGMAWHIGRSGDSIRFRIVDLRRGCALAACNWSTRCAEQSPVAITPDKRFFC